MYLLMFTLTLQAGSLVERKDDLLKLRVEVNRVLITSTPAASLTHGFTALHETYISYP